MFAVRASWPVVTGGDGPTFSAPRTEAGPWPGKVPVCVCPCGMEPIAGCTAGLLRGHARLLGDTPEQHRFTQ